MKPLRMFAWLLAAACAVYAASNLLFVYRYWWPEPFSDQRHWIDALYRGGAWSAFTLAVNEHRPLTHSALFLFDWYAFSGSQVVLECLVLLTHLGAFALLFEPIRRSSLPRPVVLTMAGLTMVCATWLLQCENLCWPLELSFTLANLGNVSACWFASRLWAGPSILTWTSAFRSALAPVVCAAAGTFAFGHGLAAWPALAMFSLAARQFRLAAVMALGGAAVVSGYAAAGVHSTPSTDLASIVNFALVFLGRPFAPAWSFDGMLGRLSDGIAFSTYPWIWVASISGLVVLCFFLASHLLRRPPAFERGFYLSVAVIAVGAALLTAIGRAYAGAGLAFASRYVSAQLLFWLPLAALGVLHWFGQERPLWTQAAWCAAIAALVAGTVPANREMGSYCREHTANLAQQNLAVRLGIFDEFGWRFMVWDPPSWMPQLARLRREGKTTFSGRDVAPVAKALPQDFREMPCQGEINKTRIVETPEGPARVVTGWAWDPSQRIEASRIVLVRPGDRVIVGAGYPGAFYFMSTGAQSEPAMWNTGFTAHARPTHHPEPFQTWAHFGGNRYCRIGTMQP
ncbi:MAG: hypothetical protein U0Q16_29785 [Bryobacteraceae bacterium]